MNYSKHENTKEKVRHISPKKKVKNKTGIIIIRVLIAMIFIVGFASAGVVFGAYLGIIEKAPALPTITASMGTFTTFIYDEYGNQIDQLDGGENREYVKLSEIPKNLQNAFIAIEDERFREHDGVDIKGLFRAVYVTLTSDRSEGASTITQQLIKNKLGLMRNTYITKIQEQYLAVEFEKGLVEQLITKEAAKNYILELYLNEIALGHGQLGVQAAAKYYFNKEVSELTLSECAVISAITQNPVGYSPIRFPQENVKRAGVALDKMLELGFITQYEYDTAKKDDPYSRLAITTSTMSETSIHSYYVDQAITSLIDDLVDKKGMTRSQASNYVYTSGLKIYVAMDTQIQAIVDEAFTNEELFPKKEFEYSVTYDIEVKDITTGTKKTYKEKTVVATLEEAEAFILSIQEKYVGANGEMTYDTKSIVKQPQSAMAIIDQTTGRVVAIAGGRGEKLANLGLNRATQSKRQPGSTFKVLASFAPALDMGLITPASVVDDIPFTQGKWSPGNWYRNQQYPYRGLSTIREGITSSMNIVTIKNMYNTGVNNCMQYLQDFGFTTLVNEDYNLSTAIGGITDGVTQLELAAAFATIANDGIYNEPYFYTKVLDHDGNILFQYEPAPVSVIKKTTSFLLTNMMKDVITGQGGTGGRAGFKDYKMPVVGKTGTTSNNHDLIFSGYTPYYTASVWIGYDLPKALLSDSSNFSKDMWSYVMERIHAEKELAYKDFEKPEGIVQAVVCRESGMLSVEGLCDMDPRGTMAYKEYFAVGTKPTDYCSTHVKYTVDTSTNHLASEFCPQELIETRVGITRTEFIDPAMFSKIADHQYEVPLAVREGVRCTFHSTPIITTDEYGNPISIESPSEPIMTEPLLPLSSDSAESNASYLQQSNAQDAPIVHTLPTQTTPLSTPQSSPPALPSATASASAVTTPPPEVTPRTTDITPPQSTPQSTPTPSPSPTPNTSSGNPLMPGDPSISFP